MRLILQSDAKQPAAARRGSQAALEGSFRLSLQPGVAHDVVLDAVTKVGEYMVHSTLTLLGGKRTQASMNGPFPLTVKPGAAAASSSEFSVYHLEATAGEAVELTLTLRDGYSNRRAVGGDAVSVQLTPLDGSEKASSASTAGAAAGGRRRSSVVAPRRGSVATPPPRPGSAPAATKREVSDTLEINDIGDGTYTVRIVRRRACAYTLTATVGGRSVPGAVAIEVTPAPTHAPSSRLEALEWAYVNEQLQNSCVWTCDAFGNTTLGGSGGFQASLMPLGGGGGGGKKKSVADVAELATAAVATGGKAWLEDAGGGVCTVRAVARRPGRYSLAVTDGDGQHARGSPCTVLVVPAAGVPPVSKPQGDALTRAVAGEFESFHIHLPELSHIPFLVDAQLAGLHVAIDPVNAAAQGSPADIELSTSRPPPPEEPKGGGKARWRCLPRRRRARRRARRRLLASRALRRRTRSASIRCEWRITASKSTARRSICGWRRGRQPPRCASWWARPRPPARWRRAVWWRLASCCATASASYARRRRVKRRWCG